MDHPSSNTAVEYRSEALLWAVRTCSAVTSDLLFLHPQAAQLQKTAKKLEEREIDRPLGRLLWQELLEQESLYVGGSTGGNRGQAEGTAAQYWQRRLQLDALRRRQSAAASLPAPWPELMRMSAAGSRELCVAVGMEMIVRAFAGYPLQRVIGMLGRLGSDWAGQVVKRLSPAAPSTRVSPAVAGHWREGYLRMVRDVAGERIVWSLGRSLIAGWYRTLPESTRTAAVALCHSNFAENLQADYFLAPVSDEEIALCAELVAGILVRGKTS